MYKAGRMWLFAGVATFTLSAGLLGLTSTQASAKTADTTPTSQQQPAVTGDDTGNGNSTTLRTTAPVPSATEQSTDKAATPTSDTTQPTDKAAMPAPDTTQPADKAATPAPDTTQPADKTATPASDATQPADKTATPALDTTQPAKKATNPAANIAQPADKAVTPAAPVAQEQSQASVKPDNGSSPDAQFKTLVDATSIDPQSDDSSTPDTTAKAPTNTVTLPGGGSFTTNSDGTFTFVDPNGNKYNIKSSQATTDQTGQPTVTDKDTNGDGIADTWNIINTVPSNTDDTTGPAKADTNITR